MPTKTTTKPKATATMPQPATHRPPTAAPKPEPIIDQKNCAERFSSFSDRWHAQVDERLTDLLEEFVKEAAPAEKHYLTEVMSYWESFGGPTRFDQHQVPILNALSMELGGDYLVPVESPEMVKEVEQFITEKLASGWKPKEREPYTPESNEAIEARIRKLLMRHVDYFTYNCRRQDMIFLVDVLEQWEGIAFNKEIKDNTKHHMAAAAEIQLELLRREDDRLKFAKANRVA